MLSRALISATVLLLVGVSMASPVRAQNLEAGKNPSQIFAGGCAVCHKSPRGLLKTIAPGALPGFLREHYTTSSEMAGSLSAYLLSNGASDTRVVGSRPGRDARSASRPSEPDPADAAPNGRKKRKLSKRARPQDAPAGSASEKSDSGSPEPARGASVTSQPGATGSAGEGRLEGLKIEAPRSDAASAPAAASSGGSAAPPDSK
jgi:hypothetical protein